MYQAGNYQNFLKLGGGGVLGDSLIKMEFEGVFVKICPRPPPPPPPLQLRTREYLESYFKVHIDQRFFLKAKSFENS